MRRAQLRKLPLRLLCPLLRCRRRLVQLGVLCVEGRGVVFRCGGVPARADGKECC
jgi:hypothetical protein